jgi:L-asparaginase
MCYYINMKKILWLKTGGTIASRETPGGLSPFDSAELMPDGGYNLDVEVVFSLDSTQITPAHWKLLSETVFERRFSADYDGFVITHGTDTMQYTAAALSFMLENFDRPVIFTGAMLPPHIEDSDALSNLKAALNAACGDSRGVYVAFAGKIINGSSCIKLHTTDRDAFIDAGPHGVTPAQGVPVLRNKLCEEVFYLKITPNISNDIIDFILEKGFKGVVCEAYGLGGVPEGLLLRLGELVKGGVRVVLVSQCLYGGVDLGVYAAHRRALDMGLEAWNMTGTAALVKLMIESALPDPVDVD